MSELPDIPEGWQWATLEDLSMSVRNGVFVSRPGKDPPGTRILRISSVRPNALDIEDVRFADPEPARAEDYFVEDGDLLFTRYSGNPAYVGACAAVGKLPGPTLHPDKLIRVVIDHRAVNPWFVQYAVNGGFVRREIEQRLKTTAGQVGIAGGQLRTVPVPVAPRNEQERIVAAIEEHLARLDAAETALMAARRRSAALAGRVVEEAIEGDTVRLGDLLREPLRNGLSARSSDTGTVRVVTLTAVTRAEFAEKHTKLIEPGVRSVNDLWMRSGDVFIQRSNTPELVGTAAMYRGEPNWAIFPDLLIRVRVNDRADPEYLELVLRSELVRRYFRRTAQGIAGSMPKVSQPIVEETPIPLPDRDRQREIVDLATSQAEGIERLQAEITTALVRCRSLRRSTLAAAFSGRLVPQDMADEPAWVLLDRIREERRAAASPSARRKTVAAT